MTYVESMLGGLASHFHLGEWISNLMQPVF